MKQVVNIGTAPNAGDGDSIRVGGDKINDNFTELYNLLEGGASGQLLRGAGVSTLSAWSTFTIPATISAKSIFISNSANVLAELTPSAGQSIRINAGGTAWEAYTPTAAVTSIVGITGTKAEFNTALTDGDFLYVGDITQYTDELAQDAIGAMVDSTLVYVDGTPSLGRAAITGAVSIPLGSNVSTLGTGVVGISNLSATGTPSASTYLRGDNTWATVAGAGDVSANTTGDDNDILRFDGTGVKVIQGSASTLSDNGDITLGKAGTGGTTRTITANGSSVVELIVKGMTASGATGGTLTIEAGGVTSGNFNGGNLALYAGSGNGTGVYGNVSMYGTSITIGAKVPSQSDAQLYWSSSTSTATLLVGGGNSGAGTTYNTIIQPNTTGGASVAGADLALIGGAAGTGNNNGGDIFLDGGAKSGTGVVGNIGLFAQSASWNGMSRGLYMKVADSAPTSAPSQGVYVWVQQIGSTYELMVMDSDGNVKVLS